MDYSNRRVIVPTGNNPETIVFIHQAIAALHKYISFLQTLSLFYGSIIVTFISPRQEILSLAVAATEVDIKRRQSLPVYEKVFG